MNKGIYSLVCLLALLALPGCWSSKEEKAPEAPKVEAPAAVEGQEAKTAPVEEATQAPAEQKPTEAQPAPEAQAKI